jgi:hypothetical protein
MRSRTWRTPVQRRQRTAGDIGYVGAAITGRRRCSINRSSGTASVTTIRRPRSCASAGIRSTTSVTRSAPCTRARARGLRSIQRRRGGYTAGGEAAALRGDPAVQEQFLRTAHDAPGTDRRHKRPTFRLSISLIHVHIGVQYLACKESRLLCCGTALAGQSSRGDGALGH